MNDFYTFYAFLMLVSSVRYLLFIHTHNVELRKRKTVPVTIVKCSRLIFTNMKIAIIGATGQTGLEAVKQALAANHSVTALVR